MCDSGSVESKEFSFMIEIKLQTQPTDTRFEWKYVVIHAQHEGGKYNERNPVL